MTDTANHLVPEQGKLRRALAAVFAWLQAMESTSFDYTLDRIERLEREVGQLKEELRESRDTGPVDTHNGSAAGTLMAAELPSMNSSALSFRLARRRPLLKAISLDWQDQLDTLVADVPNLLIHRPDFQAVIGAGFEDRQQFFLGGWLFAQPLRPIRLCKMTGMRSCSLPMTPFAAGQDGAALNLIA